MPTPLPAGGSDPGARHPWIERAALAVFVALYLWLMRTELPNGDGRVYMHQIEAGQLVWNPNHLLMQPIGLWWWRVVESLGLGWTLFGALRVLVGIAAVTSVAFFHAALSHVLPGRRAVRILATLALVFSAHFLSMAIAEEYYMVQMPWLAAALLLAVWWADAGTPPARQRALLAGIGVLTALATAIQINNVFLVFTLGVAAALRVEPGRRVSPANALAVWIPCALVGIPLFIGLYLATASGSFVHWMTAYQGQASNASSQLYGIRWTPSGIAVSVATLAYGCIACLFVLGQLGAVVEGVARGRTLEFLPEPASIASSAVLFVCLVALFVPLFWWMVTRGRQRTIARVAVAWIAAYLAFNFLWVDTSDQFYFELLPAFWLLMALFVADAPAGAWWRAAALWIVVPALAIGNTIEVVGPRAFAHAADRRADFAAMIHDDDLFVTTGWDDLLWMPPSLDGRRYERVLLMDLALRSRRGDAAIEQLPAQIGAHLAAGHRVVVARVFDRDGEGRPWEQLAKLGWPRPRLQELFGGFDHQPIATIDGVVFHEVRARTGAAPTAPPPAPPAASR